MNEFLPFFHRMSKKYATIALDRMKAAVGTSTQSESEGTFLECLLARRDFDIDSLCDLMNDLMIAAVETVSFFHKSKCNRCRCYTVKLLFGEGETPSPAVLPAP